MRLHQLLFLTAAVILIVVIAGCVDSIGITNLADLTRNPENYIGKPIELEGYTIDYGSSFEDVWIFGTNLDGLWILIDNQKYEFPIKIYEEPGRILLSQKHYRVKGIVKSIDVCICETNTAGGWMNFYKVLGRGLYPVESCRNETDSEKRCIVDSYEKFYYLEVTEPMKLITA